jgi:hypothetical protein
MRPSLHFQNSQSKMDLRYESRTPALQEQSPEFKLQPHQKEKENKKQE